MTKNTSVALYKERTLPSLGFFAATLFIPLALFIIALPFSEVALLQLRPNDLEPHRWRRLRASRSEAHELSVNKYAR
jgi:hypothetical protein